MVYEPLYDALQISVVTVRVCSKLKTGWKSVVFTNQSRKNSRHFVGVFNRTIIPLALVGYELIIANSDPTRTRGIIVNLPGTDEWRSSEGNMFQAEVCPILNEFKIEQLVWFEELCRTLTRVRRDLARVVQTLDSSIHRIDHYPADKYYENQSRYPLDRFLSGG